MTRRERIEATILGVWKIAALCGMGSAVAEAMTMVPDDQAAINKAIAYLDELGKEAEGTSPGWPELQRFDQIGQLKRARADLRLAKAAPELDDVGYQRRQIARDLDNLVWLEEAAKAFIGVMAEALKRPCPPPRENLGVRDLAGSQAGRAAVVVGGGPSLARNLRLLRGQEDRVVIIATQTVLKRMLAEGITPHFVCALDWSDLCGRFYEGLTGPDVAWCHLVCQVEANPVIPESWPGVLRISGDQEADRWCGQALSPKLGTLRRTANVAQMGYVLARHMGCDPVIHIGQDLGYTDGLYYGPGAAIHQVWSSELNEFRTLEMLEWERIVRNKGSNTSRPDGRGGQVITDAIMLTYLQGFVSLWGEDIAKGLRVIDATEGGVDKAPAVPMPLADALRAFGGEYRRVHPPPLRVASLEAEVRKFHVERLLETAGHAR